MAEQTKLSMAVDQRLIRTVGWLGSFSLAGAAAFALTMNAAFYDSFPSPHLAVVLLAVLLLHILRCPHLLWCREMELYAWFVIYMFFELLWTQDRLLALNTLFPAVNFLVIMIVFGSLATFHNSRAVLGGAVGGFLAGALVFTYATGFPFVYPSAFSYNAIATMYVFGLFLVLLYDRIQRSLGMLSLISLVLLALILATTSIKTNLGVVVGATTASLVYFGYLRKALLRNLALLLILVGSFGFVIVSNDTLRNRLENGIARVSLGLEIIQTRENVRGYSGFESRRKWVAEGLSGWLDNPVFGHGVEALRGKIGITSHATPVDLLYNSGLVGFVLFYSIFLSLFVRLVLARSQIDGSVNAVVFGAIMCFLFITMSATMHYSTFLAAAIAISVAILRRHNELGSLSDSRSAVMGR